MYETMPGWQEDISHARSMKELPKEAQDYCYRIFQLAKEANPKVRMMGVGVGKDQEAFAWD